MNIRQATVSHLSLQPAHPPADLLLQVNDLLGMQKANLFNLPENYTFKYCQSPARPRFTSSQQARADTNPRNARVALVINDRSVPCDDMARAQLCRREPQGRSRRVHLSQNVSPFPACLYPVLSSPLMEKDQDGSRS